MKIFSALRGALAGWWAILRGNSAWTRHFDLTRGGFITAFIIYLLAAFLALLSGGGAGALNPINVIIGLGVFALYILALAASVFSTRAVLQWRGSVFDLLVPGIYLLIVHLILGSLTILFGAPMILVALIVAGVLLFRLARIAAGWNFGVSAAFAVFTCILLVVIPMTLYMLASSQTLPT